MDITELGAIGELVGGVAVIASLIYVGMQVRQGTAATRSSVHQMAAASSTALLARSADSQLFEIVRAANESYDALSEQDRNVFDNHMMATFNYVESLYYDHLAGAVHSDVWESRVRRMEFVFETRPGSRRVWRKSASLYGESFQAFVEAQVLPGNSEA